MKLPTTRLMRKLQEEGLTLALVESMTCGLMAHQLCNVRGTSEVLKGSLVCYHPEVKIGLVKVPASLIRKYSAESQEVTDALVKNLPKLFNADVYMAVTGLAAAGGSEEPGKPVGSVFLSVWYKGSLHQLNRVFRGSPLEIRKKACIAAYEFALEVIGGQHGKKS